jgi:hypothetical protein
MICVDGKYKHFKDENNLTGLSNDGSRELVKSYDNALLFTVANAYEIQKRQKYVDVCDMNKYDFLLIVDSDEYVLDYDKELFETELGVIAGEPWAQYNVFAVMLEINSPNYDHIVHKLSGSMAGPPEFTAEKQFAHSPRLWQRPYEMEYNVTHYNFRHKHPSSSFHWQETNAAVKIVQGLTLGHDHNLREQSFLDKRLGYQKWLVDFEQEKLRRYMHEKKITPKIDDYDSIDCNAHKSTI